MIDKKCFTTEWIAQKASELQFNDKNLIEKAIRAFSLLDLLAASGCPFHFKGGSCLMLLLQGERHRLSIDIDIVCPPNVNVEDYLNEYSESGFLEYELVERKQSISKVPKSHRKFFYQVAYQANSTQKQYILLDVLYEDCHYVATQKMPISSDLIACVGATALVNVPSISDILGDKLTAFAPDTIGVPYYKHEKMASVEIIKQLYDVGRLFEKVGNLSITAASFRKIALIEMGYRGMTGELGLIFEDIRSTAFNMATRGGLNKDKFQLLQQGVKNISPFIYKGQYHIEEAIADAAKAAYLATLIELGETKLIHYDGNPESIALMEIGKTLSNKLNKLRVNNPEAFFYWAKVGELLDGKTI